MTDLKIGYRTIKELIDTTAPDNVPDAVARQYGGVEAALDHVFDLYRQSFAPERAGGAGGRFQFDVVTPEGEQVYVLTIQDGKCEVGRDSDADPTVTIRLGLADFLRMSTGNTNGAMLAMSGKLEVTGDMMASMNLADWFVMPDDGV